MFSLFLLQHNNVKICSPVDRCFFYLNLHPTPTRCSLSCLTRLHVCLNSKHNTAFLLQKNYILEEFLVFVCVFKNKIG